MRLTPYYKKQLERGIQYQDFVYEILARNGIMTVAYGSRLWQLRHGENKARIEIKFDDRPCYVALALCSVQSQRLMQSRAPNKKPVR